MIMESLKLQFKTTRKKVLKNQQKKDNWMFYSWEHPQKTKTLCIVKLRMFKNVSAFR